MKAQDLPKVRRWRTAAALGFLTPVLLLACSGSAFAMMASPPTVHCSWLECKTCVEAEGMPDGSKRCVKCGWIGLECKGRASATIKNDVDVYDSPVEPRRVIGIMPGGQGQSTEILEYHPHGWCRLHLEAWGLGLGWIAHNHLEGCPAPGATPDFKE